jgi:predicted nucleic-acid-binding Zn-ribbon protein
MKYYTSCPNCKCRTISQRWVESSNNEVKEIDLAEYGNNLIEDFVKEKSKVSPWATITNPISSSCSTATYTVTNGGYLTGTIGYGIQTPSSKDEILKKYIQLVLQCNECGYTEIVSIDKYRVASEL